MTTNNYKTMLQPTMHNWKHKQKISMWLRFRSNLNMWPQH